MGSTIDTDIAGLSIKKHTHSLYFSLCFSLAPPPPLSVINMNAYL